MPGRFPELSWTYFLFFGFPNVIWYDSTRRTLAATTYSFSRVIDRVKCSAKYISSRYCSVTSKIIKDTAYFVYIFTPSEINYDIYYNGFMSSKTFRNLGREYVLTVIFRIYKAFPNNALTKHVCRYFAPKDITIAFKSPSFIEKQFCVYCDSYASNHNATCLNYVDFHPIAVIDAMNSKFIELLSLPNNFIHWHCIRHTIYFAQIPSVFFDSVCIVFNYRAGICRMYCIRTHNGITRKFVVHLSDLWSESNCSFIRNRISFYYKQNVPLLSLQELCVQKAVEMYIIRPLTPCLSEKLITKPCLDMILASSCLNNISTHVFNSVIRMA